MVKKTEGFAILKDGRSIDKYILENSKGTRVDILTLGATIQNIYVKDCKGNMLDIVLGYDDIKGYLKSDYQGATVGPYANRIAGGTFNLSGKEYRLEKNDDGINSLHSNRMLTNANWQGCIIDDNTVKFVCFTKDGNQGYPGNINFELTYSLFDDNSLHMEYFATTDKETLINPTDHTYFNLSGYDSGPILDTILQINASQYTPVDNNKIPTGEIEDVKGTPLTFLDPQAIGNHINDDFDQLIKTRGYDHNYCIDGADGSLIKAATAYDENSGICLEVLTTLPGVQFYAGNFLNGELGKKGTPMHERTGFCLETQFYPDSPNKPHFPQCLILPGEHYSSKTVYKFGNRR